jgi:hypothetical protein
LPVGGRIDTKHIANSLRTEVLLERVIERRKHAVGVLDEGGEDRRLLVRPVPRPEAASEAESAARDAGQQDQDRGDDPDDRW